MALGIAGKIFKEQLKGVRWSLHKVVANVNEKTFEVGKDFQLICFHRSDIFVLAFNYPSN